MIDSSILSITNHNNQQAVEFAQAVTSLRVNYDIAGASQLTIDVADFRLEMWNANYFNIGNQVMFKGTQKFRIASTELRQSDGDYFTITIQARTEAVQRMKEDRKPESFRSKFGFEFALQVARNFGLTPIIETDTGVKQQTIKVKSEKNTESVWDVLQRSASDIQYMCFVADNYLFYASPKWLLGRWGIDVLEAGSDKTLMYVPLIFPSDPGFRFYLMEMPNVRRSEDSPKESEGSARLWSGENFENAEGNAYQLRPGMTVVVYGIKGFEQAYIITSVDYVFGSPDAIEIAFATVASLAPEDKAAIDKKVSETVVIEGTGGR